MNFSYKKIRKNFIFLLIFAISSCQNYSTEYNSQEKINVSSLSEIKQGALICKQNSKRKSEQNVDVIYTTVSNITKTKIIGQVETTNVKHIDI